MKLQGYHYTFTFTRAETERIALNYHAAVNNTQVWYQDIPYKLIGEDVEADNLTASAECNNEYHNYSDEQPDDVMTFTMVIPARCEDYQGLAAKVWDRINSYR